MPSLSAIADPLEIASLWRMNLLDGPAIAATCMRWLEADLDRGDATIAALAGDADLVVSAIAADFDRALQSLVGDMPENDEAILRALRLHLAFALADDDPRNRIGLMLGRFTHLSKRRLVHNPRRDPDRPDQRIAEQELGLEYVYSGFFAFDDVEHWPPAERQAAEVRLLADLRQAARELHDHLTAVLATPPFARS
ncbi:hypothetical protein [Caulobacter endophyticus]|uniref:hypothetical protein n=1 Tax=Caulobacter endophyticus TaxID=2172652 RepID=UPI00241044BE|nr:hypothetical protein [Caulobacter endophyticus]MDG2531212.1 hypothetical protein [Caulobacter endophyticus]